MSDRQSWELWTSDVNGHDWREVGYIDCSKPTSLPYALKWNPDGRRLSFLREKTLYVVDAG